MGSLFSNLSVMLCFDVHGVNVGESERSLLIKGGARSRTKHVLLHVPKEGIYPAFPVLCPVQLNQEVREPRLCWKEILFSSCDYVKFGIFFTWGRLVCSPSPLTVICSGRFGMNLSFLCLQGSRSFCGWTGGLECVVSGHWMWKKKHRLASYRLWFLFVLSQCDFTEVQKVVPVWETNQVHVISRQPCYQN